MNEKKIAERMFLRFLEKQKRGAYKSPRPNREGMKYDKSKNNS
jgi:hypothetical protein